VTNFERLGEELRGELGEPPAGWTDRQRLRLRGLDLTPKSDRRPVLLAAALAAGALLTGGIYYWPAAQGSPTASGGEQPDQRTPAKQPIDGASGEAIWVEASAKAMTRPLENGGKMTLSAGARGRLDQQKDLGTRFDLHEGTASFDVPKQEGKPFSVVAGEYRVVVVGTRFVTAYVPPRMLNVTVEEGAVQVHLPGRSVPVGVDAGEVLEVRGQEFSLRREGDDPASFAAAEADGNGEAKTAGSADASWQDLYRNGKYQQACARARADSISKLKGSLNASEMVELANALRLCGDTGSAMSTLVTLRQRHPTSPQAHDALFLIGRIYAAGGQSAEAIAHWEKYLAGAGGGRFAAESLGRLIELHEAGGNHEKARIYAQRYLKLAPQGAYRRLAESVAGRP
jgi:TolA-binding protein